MISVTQITGIQNKRRVVQQEKIEMVLPKEGE